MGNTLAYLFSQNKFVKWLFNWIKVLYSACILLKNSWNWHYQLEHVISFNLIPITKILDSICKRYGFYKYWSNLPKIWILAILIHQQMQLVPWCMRLNFKDSKTIYHTWRPFKVEPTFPFLRISKTSKCHKRGFCFLYFNITQNLLNYYWKWHYWLGIVLLNISITHIKFLEL
jgi:hypothetical protein